ncbi:MULTISPECIES: Smr/MutS family protein [unclassified Neisseria]|uniref:Smr/MutS family protein n=1 Tax=unclassified Neisseria TaxID=2623750 RepID=UPI0010725F80|nr:MULTISPECIES: Smr/MutS family protein [unclassified Neisseria]MBF0803437.1 Smr/MutS family protein [Neisseria sp. 19428wB4_WF04]TFU43838.1 Smr domain protein [Neisseria sp. WF04]
MSNDFQSVLKKLGKQAKQAAEMQAEAEAAASRQAAQQVDFAKEMAGVTPLKNSGRYTPPRDKSPIRPRQAQADALAAEDYFYVGGGGTGEPPATFSKNGQGKNDIHRLQSGHWPVVADVDLHGYTQEQAQQVLNEFIVFTQKRGVCGEIVHGSGLGSSGYRPVLKNLVRRWLMAHPDVLAYAEPRPGNDGAVRILLKRNRPWEQES